MSPLTVSPEIQLEEIDQRLIALLSVANINVEEITMLISKRELCLANIQALKLVPAKKAWQLAIERTQYIHVLLTHHKQLALQVTQSFVRGRKVVQAYKKIE